MHRKARSVLCWLATIATLLVLWWGNPSRSAPSDTPADAEVHRRPGATQIPRPAIADPERSGRVRIVMREGTANGASGPVVPCRVVVTGSDGDCYEPSDNPLAPYSLQRLANRAGKGPFRYFGWFFYTTGDCVVAVPPGKTRIDVWRGLEYEPQSVEAIVEPGQTADVAVTLTRSVDMASRGWYSGDTHIHHDRRTETDDARILDLAAAEDIRFAHILCMNDPRTYQPTMEQQLHPQMRGMGPASEVIRGDYGIASGQEYRCGTYGHICFVGGRRLVDADGAKTNPNNWPLFSQVADELHGLGGYAFHAHGGYEQEIYADFAQQATDGVELLQFAVYRGIGLDGWYHILNAGFRFPAVGASDYPYCRALGDCRTYVRLPAVRGERPTFAAWDKAAAEGRSFFTTGPLLELSVNDKLPGDTLDRPAGPQELTVTVRMQSPAAPVDELLVVEGGRVRARRVLDRSESRGPVTWTMTLPVDRSTWIAARATAASPSGREDVEAHTNPVYVTVAGTNAVRRESVDWLLRRLDQLIAVQQARNFEQREKVVAHYRKSREILAARVDGHR